MNIPKCHKQVHKKRTEEKVKALIGGKVCLQSAESRSETTRQFFLGKKAQVQKGTLDLCSLNSSFQRKMPTDTLTDIILQVYIFVKHHDVLA